MNTIAITNLVSGEITETNIEIRQKSTDKHTKGGLKMYANGVRDLFLALTKQEGIRVIDWHDDSAIVGPNNIFKVPFRTITKDMHTVNRSQFKRKLIDSGIIIEYGKLKRIMLNPYIFMPRKDRSISDSQYLTQRAWLCLAEDKDVLTKELDMFIVSIFEE